MLSFTALSKLVDKRWRNIPAHASFSAVFLLLSASFGLQACSPGMFFGGSKDDGVSEMRNYRRINLACAGLNLANANLSVADFRRVLHCFNSNGGLEPIENLSNRMSDADLRPIVDVGNHYIINNRKLLFQLEQTYFTLSNLKILDSTFAQFGRLLQNDEFVSSSIALLKEGYSAERGPNGIAGDRSILLALQQFSTRITYDNTASMIDVALTLARSRAFNTLQTNFRGPSPGGRQLSDLTDQVLEYLQDLGDQSHVQVGYRLLVELASGDLFTAMDKLTGMDPEEFPRTIPRMTSVFNVSLANNAQIMDGLTSLFHYVHREIPCLKKSEIVPDGARFVISELVKRKTKDAATYIKHTTPLTLMALAPLCDLAPEVGKYYPSIFEMADSTAIEPMDDLIKAFDGITAIDENGATQHPLTDLLVDLLSDTGTGDATSPGGRFENPRASNFCFRRWRS